MAANTEILIKRSLANVAPTSLMQGELAYSYASNTLFIGTDNGTDVIDIGGYRDYSANYSNGIGQYGSSTQVPIITVSANGQITAIDTANISSTLNINADIGGPSTVDLLTQTLDIAGGEGLTSTVSGQTITLDVDDTVVRSNTAMQMQLIDGDIQISGNLTVLGNTTQIEVQTLNIADPLIYLASNNYSSDVVDIGFVGNYFDGANQAHTGIFRHAGDKEFYVFDGYQPEPTANTIDPTDPTFHLATLNAGTLKLQNGTVISDSGAPGLFVDSLNDNTTANVVFYDPVTKEITYGSSNVLTPSRIANGAYSMTISDIDGLVYAPQSKIVVSESVGTSGGGYSFYQDGNYDTGMFSSGDGVLSFYSNDVEMVRIVRDDGIYLYNSPLYLPNGSIVKDTSGGAIAFGYFAGDSGQSSHAIAIGANAGSTNQNISAVAIGEGAGNLNQNFSAIAIGRWAGEQYQGWDATAVGRLAGRYNQGDYATAIGWHAGRDNQSSHAVAIGDAAGDSYQGNNAVAIGSTAGNSGQGWGAVALGMNAGYSNQNLVAVAIGSNAGRYSQSQGAVAVGRRAGESSQQDYAVAVGRYAGRNSQSQHAVAVGHVAGESSQGNYAVALGYGAGNNTQGESAIALGVNAGSTNQQAQAIAIGNGAGYSNQQDSAIAIGYSAGGSNQEQGAVGIGRNAGQGAHQYSVSLGYQAGYADDTALGDYAIAIGYRAGFTSGAINSIVLNASGSDLSAASSGLYINPVRYEETQDAVDDGLMFYNQSTKEVRYSYILDGGSF